VEIELPKIDLAVSIIKGEKRIVISAVKDPILENLIRRVSGAKYLRSGNWHLPCQRAGYEELKRLLEGKARLNTSLARPYQELYVMVNHEAGL
jgi:hypothetical protein